MKKTFKRFLSVFLAALMVITVIPMGVYAAETEETEAVQVSELEESRDLYSKTYETSENTNVVISAAVPLHYEENGKLKDIDNTLVKSKEDNSVLTNAANAYNVELPKKYTDDSEIKIDYQGNSVSFKLINDVKSSKGDIAETEKVDLDESNAESVVYAESNMDKLSSSITYENIMPNTDFEYNVQPNALKENIILNKVPEENYIVQYELSTGNLEAVLNEDNSISLIDSDKNEVFLVESPYMIDANDAISEDVTVLLEESENSYVLTYEPNYSWLLNEDTTYPVTIDPTIIIDSDNNGIDDTYVTDETPTRIKYSLKKCAVGNYVNSKDKTINEWTYYKINSFPVLPQGSSIIKATFNVSTAATLNENPNVPSQNNLAIYKINNDLEKTFNIAPSKMTWNNKAAIEDKPIDYSHNTGIAETLSFDISTTVDYWIKNSIDNKYLVVKPFDKTSQSIPLISSRTESDNIPYIYFEYSTTNGLSEKNQFHSQDLSLAGTSYINDLNGELIVERTEFVSNSSIGGIKFYIGTNVNAPANNCFDTNKSEDGNKNLKVSMNYYKTLEYSKVDNGYPFFIKSADGNIEYYTQDEVVIEDDTITVTTKEDGEEKTTETFDSTILSYSETTDDSDKTYFLTNIKNYSNENLVNSEIKIEYNDNHCIKNVSDSISNFTFVYDNNSKLTDIEYHSYIDKDEDYYNIVSEENYILDMYNHYSYTNNSITCELGISDLDYPTNTIVYENSDNKIRIATETGSYYLYTLNNNQVTEVWEFSADGTAGEYLTFEYGNNSTTISNGKNTYTEYFDLAGNLVSIVDQDGNAIFAQYKDNLISKISQTRNSARNISDFYNFENVKDCVFAPENKGDLEVSLTNEQSFNGSSSVKLVNNTNGEGFFSKILNNLEKDSTYTISMWVYLENATAKCTLTLENAFGIGTVTHAHSQNKTGWQQLACTINTDNSDNPIINVKLKTDNSGISTSDIKPVYVDNMYIQKSPYLTNVNLLENGDFSNELNKWATDNNNITVESEDANISTIDNNRLKIAGDYLSENSISQTVSITANAKGTKYTYGGWIKSVDTLPEKEGTNREISLSVYGINSDGTTSLLDKTIYSSYLSNWQYIESELTLPNDNITQLKFVISNNYQTGYTMFDGLSLSQDELYTIEFEYDENNEIKSIIANGTTVSLTEDDNADNESALNTSYEYDEFGNITKLTDTATVDDIAQTIVSKFEYGNNGSLLTKQSNDVGKWINYKYDYFGNVASIVDANGNKVEYEYDNFQNLSAVINQFEYNQSASGSDTEDPPKNWNNEETTLKIQYSYTGNRLDKIETGNVEDSEFSATNTYLLQYDKWGNLSDIFINNTEEPYIHYAYNEKDSEHGKTKYHQLSSVTYVNSQEIHYEYDKNDNIIYEYDSDNKDGDTLSYSYFYYDDGTCYGKKNLITGTVETYQDGITTQKDADGNIIHSYGYDSDGRLYEIIGDDSITTSVANISTNGINTSTQNTVVNGNENVISQETDQFGRILTQKVKMGENYLIKKYTYFSTNELNNSENENSSETTYSVKSIKYFLDGNIDEPIYTFDYTYDNNGNVLTETSDNSASDENVTLTYSYNENNMLTAVDSRENKYGGKFDINMIFKYDSQGNIIHWKRDYRTSGNSDWMNIQYSSDDTGTYIDNVVSEFPYEHDNWNISHDKMGNMTSIKQTVEKGHFTNDNCVEMKYNWDRGNVLSNISFYNLPDGDSNSPILRTSANYEYDDNNIRTKKEFAASNYLWENSSENGLSGNVQYFWRDGLLTGEHIEYTGEAMKESDVTGKSVDNSGSYKTTILYDQNNNAYGFVLTKLKDADGNSVNETNTYYYLKDMNNTVIAIVDENGQIRINYENVPYGLNGYQAYNFGDNYLGILNPLTYRDYIYDVESRMYYLKSRYYMPELCRFISADNLLDTGTKTAMSTNLYSYCENDPINNIDPYGYAKINVTWIDVTIDILIIVIPCVGEVNAALAKAGKPSSKIISKATTIFTNYSSKISEFIGSALKKVCSKSLAASISSTVVKGLLKAMTMFTIFSSIGNFIEYVIDCLDNSWDGYLDTGKKLGIHIITKKGY